jgi:D-alanyl-D-alanine carboxypeptidase
MPKKILTTIGILLLLGVIALGGWTFLQRHHKKELPTTSSSPVKNATKETATSPVVPSFDKTQYSLTDPSSIWVITNKTHPLNPLQYAPTDLVAIGSQQMRKEAADALTALIAAAKAENLTISPLSGYRSYSNQVTVYNNEVKNYGQATADTESAKPGYSEHQTGLAVDVGGGGCGIEDCFGNTAEGKWVALNAYKYGYIVRYTADKQAVTGYRAEPWHIRYIGTDLSQEMYTKKITTLEEYFNF